MTSFEFGIVHNSTSNPTASFDCYLMSMNLFIYSVVFYYVNPLLILYDNISHV
uniref:Uncharacterized protein n=1 Tax=Lepeophtheirus salmonis TaxID=72036 RepID=A0A0K2U1A9_LEPSM